MCGEEKQLYCVCKHESTLLSKIQNAKKNKSLTLADGLQLFYSRHHLTKPKDHLQRRSQNRQWIPMFIETPCLSEEEYKFCAKLLCMEALIKNYVSLK